MSTDENIKCDYETPIGTERDFRQAFKNILDDKKHKSYNRFPYLMKLFLEVGKYLRKPAIITNEFQLLRAHPLSYKTEVLEAINENKINLSEITKWMQTEDPSYIGWFYKLCITCSTQPFLSPISCDLLSHSFRATPSSCDELIKKLPIANMYVLADFLITIKASLDKNAELNKIGFRQCALSFALHFTGWNEEAEKSKTKQSHKFCIADFMEFLVKKYLKYEPVISSIDFPDRYSEIYPRFRDGPPLDFKYLMLALRNGVKPLPPKKLKFAYAALLQLPAYQDDIFISNGQTDLVNQFFLEITNKSIGIYEFEMWINKLFNGDDIAQLLKLLVSKYCAGGILNTRAMLQIIECRAKSRRKDKITILKELDPILSQLSEHKLYLLFYFLIILKAMRSENRTVKVFGDFAIEQHLLPIFFQVDFQSPELESLKQNGSKLRRSSKSTSNLSMFINYKTSLMWMINFLIKAELRQTELW